MFGRILKVDLTSGDIQRDNLPRELIEGYIGGSGMAARLLWDELDPQRDPLDPRNSLLFITGPLTGTGGPTTGRFTVCGRSPQTGWWGEANIGGFVGTELRLAGVDVLWITGQAADPVYLFIHNDAVEIHLANHLWGQTDTYETQLRIRDETGQPKAKVACIGLAGENLVPFAGILSDHGRLAARAGLGALMGSKKLKAVAVRGTGQIPLARPEQYKSLRLASNKRLIDQNLTAVLRATGTSGAADYLQYLGDMPQKYWTQATFENASNVGGAEMSETILAGTSACQGCVISCGRVVEVNKGPFATHGKAKGPEYETVCAFGPQLLVDDLAQISALGDRCDRLGLDSISAGSAIGLAYLLYEKGLLTQAETGGIELMWGNALPCFDLLEKIALRQGFGAQLAEGSLALATRYGQPDLAVQVHGMDVAMHDPRAFSGQSLSYVLSPRGACHNQSDFFNVELGGTMEEIGIPMTERFTDAGKAGYVARHQHWRTVCNSLTICFFAVVQPQEIVELLNAAIGLDWDVETLLKAGERAWNLKRMYNLRLGWTPASEKLPKLLQLPLHGGGQAGNTPDLQVLLDEYYTASGWDRISGWPLPDKLADLNLIGLLKTTGDILT